MRSIILSIFILSCIIISCKKTDTGLSNPQLIASWHLYSYGSILFPKTPTDNIILTFQSSGKYNQTSNSVVTEIGSYSLQHYNDSTYATEINFLPDTSDNYKTLMNLHNDTLILLPEVVSTDGYFLAYTKQ